MIKQYAVAALCCWSWTVLAVPASAQAAELTSRDIIRAVQSPLDMKDFQNPGMTIKEVLGLIHDHVATAGILGKGVGLPVLIDQQGFKDANPEAGDLYESPVKFPPYPKKMTLATALQLALAQCHIEATYVVRRGWIEIIPAKQNRFDIALKRKVIADFDRRPFDEAMHELAEQTGVSIQLDSRAVKDKQNIVVTALFRNDTSLRDALVMLADMANLQVVELPTGVYVTSPANAEFLKKAKTK